MPPIAVDSPHQCRAVRASLSNDDLSPEEGGEQRRQSQARARVPWAHSPLRLPLPSQGYGRGKVSSLSVPAR